MDSEKTFNRRERKGSSSLEPSQTLLFELNLRPLRSLRLRLQENLPPSITKSSPLSSTYSVLKLAALDGFSVGASTPSLVSGTATKVHQGKA
jgi:hypothetical protein